MTGFLAWSFLGYNGVMAENLTTIQSDGTQNTTQNPQVAGNDTGGGTQSSTLQTGTPVSALNSTVGVPLATRSTAGKTAAPTLSQTAHHASPVLTVLAVLLFVVAMGLFGLLAREDKTTTK